MLTHEFPRWYHSGMGKELFAYLTRHDDVKYTILNDGNNPVQLRVLAENRAQLEEQIRKYNDRQKFLREEEEWCGWVNPHK
jgi:hypothetical protein